MSQRAAEIQVLLEGVALPASRRELIAYARSQDEHLAQQLEPLPERTYRSLDEVGEALAPVQPSWSESDAAVPREESGQPPGGDAYAEPHPEPGAVRRDAPPQALEKQTQAQNEQLQRQQEKLGPARTSARAGE
jgi:hypothetical protein